MGTRASVGAATRTADEGCHRQHLHRLLIWERISLFQAEGVAGLHSFGFADIQQDSARTCTAGRKRGKPARSQRGVDRVINEDRLGLDRVDIQAKRYAKGNTVGRPEVQRFVGSLVGLGATKVVFVTASTFSPQA